MLWNDSQRKLQPGPAMDQKHNCYKISLQGTKSVKTKLLTDKP